MTNNSLSSKAVPAYSLAERPGSVVAGLTLAGSRRHGAADAEPCAARQPSP
jgi:hypothetical protein